MERLAFLIMVMLSPFLIPSSSIHFFGRDIVYVEPPLICMRRVCFVSSSDCNNYSGDTE
jgi:hypothetical protein